MPETSRRGQILREARLDSRQKFSALSRDLPDATHPRTCSAEWAKCVCNQRAGRHRTHTCKCGAQWTTSNGEPVAIVYPGGSDRPTPADLKSKPGVLL